jgi:hypothetical protein
MNLAIGCKVIRNTFVSEEDLGEKTKSGLPHYSFLPDLIGSLQPRLVASDVILNDVKKIAFAWLVLLLSSCFTLAIPQHKIEALDPAAAKAIVAQGGHLIADYGGYQLYGLATLSNIPENAEVRDNYNLILLNATNLDTSQTSIQALRTPEASFGGKRLHLIHFAGPPQPAWRKSLVNAGVQIVSYIPQNAYLVYGDSSSIARLHSLATTNDYIQWEGSYLDTYKIHPRALQSKNDQFAIQLIADTNANTATLKLIDQLRLAPRQPEYRVLNYVNVIARLPATGLAQIAARPDVISIQPRFPPKKLDERQDQIIAGALTGNTPSSAGYLTWLNAVGFTQQQFDDSGFAVDISDSGIDNGTTSPNHFGLYENGETSSASRVIYNRLEGSANSGSTLEGCDGHGNINAHIAMGFDDGDGFPFADGAGYHYGLGVCPFVRVGSSVVFDPDNWTNPNYTTLMTQAYDDGARVSNNSWGDSDSDGTYNMDSQEYDSLVRDAEPSVDGNQEMNIIFAAGNDGTNNARSISAPATAKNVITVGAAQNVQPFGGEDGCDTPDSQADNANAVLDFSSRGPCDDGRHKPDLVAPGSHITGGAPQAADPAPDGTASPCFFNDASGVCGGIDGNLFYPNNQQFYTASTGTSHSTPAVTGACALVRQYFINNDLTPPSPAMTKAYLMNSARYMTGALANDTLWSETQGMGELNLGMAFDGVSRVLRDEVASDMFTASGQVRVYTGAIANSSIPFRVTVAWTDAPGNTTGHAYNNDLDLLVTVGANTYKGNVFSKSRSVTGGTADAVDNVESVFLPAGVSGNFSVMINATSINSLGVPNGGGDVNQDFALVIYNAGTVSVADTVTPNILSPANGLVTNSPTLNITGTGIPGAVLDIYDGSNLVAQTKVNNSGVFNVPVKLGAGTHSLTATETYDGVTGAASSPVVVTLNLIPTFVLQPQDETNFLKGTVIFTAQAIGAAPLHYSWQKNGVKIPGATSSNLTLANLNANSAATYQATVMNSYGEASSSPATLTLTANPFTNLSGAYYGLFAESNAQFDSSGSIVLQLTSLGKFTARILNAGGSYSLTGLLSINGQTVNTISRGAHQAPLIVNMNLDLTDGTDQILGTVSGSNWTASLQADRATFSVANPFTNRGPFTVLLQSGSDGAQSPGGDGYGRAAASVAGMISMHGVLSDNTAVASAAVSISKFGQWPLYIPLYGKLGSLIGWIDFTNNPTLAGSATWFRTNTYGKYYRAGFTNSLSIIGSPFLPGNARHAVLGLTNLQVTLSGADLAAPISNNVVLENSGKLASDGEGISRLSLTINPATGFITGSFLDPVTQLLTPIKGAVFQEQTNAGGFFLGTTESGTFTLQAP